ncbi:energy-coupling factor ABC transporter ATP-binding protein [Methanosarcinales archaeon ex4572_44]|nr:MAG: energy-coupling factor ABC transporter ATP-binding protein [Methanosarcinales archaeon ex4572_44]RLG26983.1 MAG: energy-coupling factor ABC transporter ATP-binding protein [Methanosarcinales archaeon]RLG28573.1 MAG: energy-coupling factor ABC transporter ATP-binding protein [Methanosarcinales archaeon]
MREAVTTRNLNYSYPDGTIALNNINITIQEGERVAIVGPNGAGKTTFLLHLNGILQNTDGEVKIFGKNVNEAEREDIIKNVGVVFQDPDDQLFMPTIFDDVAFGPMNLELNENEVRRRVKNSLTRLGLTGYDERCSHHLSYGEKKRASLAAVISMEPRILVLDEPTANLDPKSRAELIKIINELNRDGVTIIITTHDINAVPELVDRVYVLNRTIIAEGIIREIFSDAKLLKENHLEVPEVFKLFEVLKCFGYNCEELPLSINEAIENLTKTIGTNGGHIHLHIHEHTHEETEKVKHKYRYDHH